MRSVLLALLAACGAPAPTPDASAARLPPSQPLDLTVSPLVVGGAAELRVTGAPPGARLELFRAGGVRSDCLTTPSGACGLLRGAPTRVATLTANGQGVAVARWTMPPGLPRVALQAFAGARASDAVFRWVHPAGTPLDDVDRDGDGVSWADGDCHAADPAVSPLAADPPDDGADRNCDGVDSVDADRDGSEAAAVGGEDCDDSDPTVRPGLADPYGDGVDANCDGVDGIDADGDGSPFPEDCDDRTPTVRPGLADPYGDGVDANCDGVDGIDADGDGSPFPEDCDDRTPTVRPGLADPYGDGVDANCDGVDGIDADGDGSPFPEDCDDRTPLVSPLLADPYGDGVDSNCDGVDGIDADGDGSPFPEDCDDRTPLVSPLLADPYGDGVDANCDGVDGIDADGDGSPSPLDCVDIDPEVYPNAPDARGDGVDHDCDGVDGPGARVIPGRPDLDGDRIADLVIGAPGEDVLGVASGAAWILRGGLNGPQQAGFRRIVRDGFTVTGPNIAGAELGARMAAGDVNGDGVDDLVFGAPRLQAIESSDAVSVVLGGPGLMTPFFQRPWYADHAGHRVVVADQDGDGFDDLFWASPQPVANANVLQVFRGAANGMARVGAWSNLQAARPCLGMTTARVGAQVGVVCTTEFDPGRIVVHQQENRVSLGRGVTTAATTLAAGDVDGDGLDDVLVGLPDHGVGVGAGVLMWGQPGALGSPTMYAASEMGWGVAAGTRLGGGVALCDLTGDGRDEVIMTTEADAAVWVMPGADVPDPGAAWRLPVTGWVGATGAMTVGCGDYNADGFEDLVAGQPALTVGGVIRGGQVKVWFGGPAGPRAAADQTWDHQVLGVGGVDQRFGHTAPRVR